MTTTSPNRQRRAVLRAVAAAGAISCMPRGIASSGDSRRTAVVIGAGIAGLSAAHEMRKAGFNVTVFEKRDFTGGRMREAWMGPLYGFTHAQGVLKANREMFGLAADLGISDELDGPVLLSTIDNGIGTYSRALRFRIDEVGKIPGLAESTKQQLPRLQADLDRFRQEVDPCLLSTGATYDDESIQEYYNRMLTAEGARELMRYWIDPVLEAWGWPASQTSKITLLSWFATDAEFVGPRGGIGVLTRKLASQIPVQTQTSVRFITPPDAAGRHTIHYLTPQLEERTLKPDVVVLATEGKFVDSLVQGLTPEQSNFFKAIDTTKEAVIFYVLDAKAAPRERIGAQYIPTHPDPVKRRLNSWSVNPAEPDNHSRPPTIRVDLSRPEVLRWQASGKTIQVYCEPLIKAVYPQFDMRNVVDIVNYTCDDLIYQPVGYARQMAAISRDQKKERRGLYFAGEYMSAAHTGGACASGRTVGRLVAEHWG